MAKAKKGKAKKYKRPSAYTRGVHQRPPKGFMRGFRGRGEVGSDHG